MDKSHNLHDFVTPAGSARARWSRSRDRDLRRRHVVSPRTRSRDGTTSRAMSSDANPSDPDAVASVEALTLGDDAGGSSPCPRARHRPRRRRERIDPEGAKAAPTPKPLTEEQRAKILTQVEFYFSDANLPTDAFLMKRVRAAPEGWVPSASSAVQPREAAPEEAPAHRRRGHPRGEVHPPDRRRRARQASTRATPPGARA